MNDFVGRRLESMRIRAVLPYIKGRLLDIGCGMNHLARAYGNGVGVDVYNWGDVDYIVDNSAILPFENASFDTATLIACLNHIPNREEVLRECGRLLKPDGRLVITMITPRILALWHLLRSPWDADQHERGMVDGEVYGFTAKQLLALVQDQGYTLVARRKFMLQLNSIYLFQKSRVISNS